MDMDSPSPLRLSGFDASFIYDERPNEPQHTVKIAILGPGAGVTHDRQALVERIRTRLPALAPLRWRVLRVPFDLHHPVCVDDPDLDVARHVHSSALPAPGGHTELCEAISWIVSQPLDPTRPLWEMWRLEGLQGGRVALVLKISHALADGSASRRLMEGFFGEASEVTPQETPPLPGRARLLLDALRDRLRDAFVGLPRLAWRTVRVLWQHRKDEPLPRPSLLHTPDTPFAGRLGRHRAFWYTSVSLAEASEIKTMFGCKLNDVLLSVAAGAVRRYLIGRGALPGLPILGFMPASTRSKEQAADWGNRLTNTVLELPTQVANPVERLRACAKTSARAKAELERRRGVSLEDWQSALPPWVSKAIAGSVRLLVWLRPKTSAGVVISNMAGPRERLRLDGVPVENLVSVGHMKYAAGLNITVWSYAEHLNFAFYACADTLPDLDSMDAHVLASFEELRKAAAREAARL